MAIANVPDLHAWSPEDLYDLYRRVAELDHEFRVRSQYGMTPPPPGHCEFRPLKRGDFLDRVRHYDTLDPCVGNALRTRLARQAVAYGCDPASVLVAQNLVAA